MTCYMKMASGPSTPRSEGEIVESTLEKATTSLDEPKGTSVDRQSRKHASMSRSPSPIRSPTRPRSRNTSRSPYRESRGSKRPVDDDHYDRSRNDPRRFKVRYEDRPSSGRGKEHPLQHDLERSGATISRQTHEDRGANGYSHNERQHRRSRSPLRNNRDHQKNHSKSFRSGRMESQPWQKHNDRTHGESRSKLSRQQSVSDRGQTLIAAAHLKRDAESKNNQTRHVDNGVNFSNLPAKYVLDLVHRCSADNNWYSREGATSAMVEETTQTANDESVDEATLIEERRKRREAIKAKHKGEATPSLIQALALDNRSAPSTPKTTALESELQAQGEHQCRISQLPTNRASTALPQDSPPDTPKGALDQNSTIDFVVTVDSDLANCNTAQNDFTERDEPSAADYDPTMDMQEDKLRQDQQQYKSEVSAAAYDETEGADQCLLLPDAPAEVATAAKASGEFDMFGDYDELDMFVEAPASTLKTQKGSTKAVPVSQGKPLDMSMLDDCDDPEGYYKVILGELLANRYLVQSNLGKGMFSAVVRATDQRTNSLVAIKLIRNNETMKKAGIKEIEILEKLTHADPEDKKHIIRLERFFEHKGHLCMVFENLSINLREVLKKFGRDVGINLKAVREYARQMFLGLSLLRKCNVLHADLKPDNVLVNESRSYLKICDLGSASDASENEITQYLVSRFYRAPEIILGLRYDFAIDMWSIGCTLFELYTGKILFTGRSNNQMLRAIMECRGKFSHKLLRKAQFAGLHFDDLLNFRSVEKDRLSGKDTVRILNFAKPTRDLKTRLMANVKGIVEAEVKELNLFLDLLDRCLNLNPEKRCSPNEALRHPFLMNTTKG